MSNADHPHPHEHKPEVRPPGPVKPAPPVTAEDAGSRALEDALRSSFLIVKVIMVILVIVFVFSGVKSIGPQELGVRFRLGKPVGVGEDQLLKPGLHLALPYPIDDIDKIAVGEIQTVTSSVGWYATTREMELSGAEPPPMPKLNPAADGYAISGDGNIVHIRAILSYRVSDPLAYQYSFVAASNVVQDILDNAVVHAAARSPVDLALYDNAGFKERVLARVAEQANQMKLGITIEPSEVRVITPRYVRAAFEEVISAEQTGDQAVLTARGQADTILTTARSDAANRVNEGRTSANRLLQSVAADARSFTEQLPQYQANPRLFRERLLTETWSQVLGRLTNSFDDKWIIPDSAGGNTREFRILLNREPPKSRRSETNAPGR